MGSTHPYLLLECMFSELTIRHWTTNQCVLPWRGLHVFPAYLDCSLCNIEAEYMPFCFPCYTYLMSEGYRIILWLQKKYEFENNRNKWSHITLATIQRGPLVAAETAEDIKTLDKKPNTSRSILGTTWWKGKTQLPQVILGFLHGFKHGHVQATWTHTTGLLKKKVSKREKERGKWGPSV